MLSNVFNLQFYVFPKIPKIREETQTLLWNFSPSRCRMTCLSTNTFLMLLPCGSSTLFNGILGSNQNLHCEGFGSNIYNYHHFINRSLGTFITLHKARTVYLGGGETKLLPDSASYGLWCFSIIMSGYN